MKTILKTISQRTKALHRDFFSSSSENQMFQEPFSSSLSFSSGTNERKRSNEKTSRFKKFRKLNVTLKFPNRHFFG